jgi:hypothetical protein
MREHNAYNFGAFVKCAEAGVSPQDLYAYGQRMNDVQLMKLAQAAHLGANVSPMEKAAIMNWLKGTAGKVTDSFKSLGALPGRAKHLWGDWQAAGDVAQKGRAAMQHADRAAAGGNATAATRYSNLANKRLSDADEARSAVTENVKNIAQQAMPAAATVGAGGLATGGAGMAYGLGDADTTENKMKQTSNRYLGTNFDTQSRLGALFG